MANQDNKNEVDIKELQGELGKKISLHTLHDSEGGKLLINALVADILSAVDRIADQTGTLTLQEFISLGCKIKERRDIVNILTSAQAGREIYTELLDEAMKKEEENPPEQGK